MLHLLLSFLYIIVVNKISCKSDLTFSQKFEGLLIKLHLSRQIIHLLMSEILGHEQWEIGILLLPRSVRYFITFLRLLIFWQLPGRLIGRKNYLRLLA